MDEKKSTYVVIYSGNSHFDKISPIWILKAGLSLGDLSRDADTDAGNPHVDIVNNPYCPLPLMSDSHGCGKQADLGALGKTQLQNNTSMMTVW